MEYHKDTGEEIAQKNAKNQLQQTHHEWWSQNEIGCSEDGRQQKPKRIVKYKLEVKRKSGKTKMPWKDFRPVEYLFTGRQKMTVEEIASQRTMEECHREIIFWKQLKDDDETWHLCFQLSQLCKKIRNYWRIWIQTFLWPNCCKLQCEHWRSHKASPDSDWDQLYDLRKTFEEFFRGGGRVTVNKTDIL